MVPNIYSEFPLQSNSSVRHAFIDEALTRVVGVYEFDTNIPQGHRTTEEEEQKIYDIPDEEDLNCGPIYTDPPAKEQEIYEVFKGKNINTLYHKDIT